MAPNTAKKPAAAAGPKPAANKPAAKSPAKSPAKSTAKSPAKSPAKSMAKAATIAVDPAPGGPAASDEKANVELKLKGLIDLVVARTGARKPQVKSVVEAVLRELGEALSAGQVLNLPGFGKARVARPAATPTGTMTLKLRRGQGGENRAEKPDGAAAQPLAKPKEAS